MDNLAQEMQQLRDANPDVIKVMDAYKEAEQAYKNGLTAMGVPTEQKWVSSNAANVTVSFRDTHATPRR